MVGMLLGPIGLVLSLVVSKNTEQLEDRAIAEGTVKRCPYCAELVKTEAVICRYCGKELPQKEIIDKVLPAASVNSSKPSVGPTLKRDSAAIFFLLCLLAAGVVFAIVFLGRDNGSVPGENNSKSLMSEHKKRMQILDSYAKCMNEYGEVVYCRRFTAIQYGLTEQQMWDVLLNTSGGR